MPYLTAPKDIEAAIADLTSAQRLWVDTEVADFKTKKPRLSLIQILADRWDLSSDLTRIGDLPNLDTLASQVYLFDVLDKPELVTDFIDRIMVNPDIEKVFHNASYDVKFLGKKKAENVTCTLVIAKQLPLFVLETSNLKLKTLAAELCGLPVSEQSEQQSDWGVRSLSESQIRYATMDPIYLACVHLRLLELDRMIQRDPASDNVEALAMEYADLKQQALLLESELSYVENRLKAAMQVQKVEQSDRVKLSSYERSTYKTPFSELAKLVQKEQLDLDFPVTLTKELRNQLGEVSDRLPIQEEKTQSWRLTLQQPEE